MRLLLLVVSVGLLAGCGASTGPALAGSSLAGAPVVDVSGFVPSAEDPDPSRRIDGVQVADYEGARHVGPQQRVAYTFTPGIGGTHDQAWAACNGVVYPEPVRTENLVHSLEHGAVWIAYDPERVDGADLDALTARVEGQQYMVMSPYPGLPQPISVQSWGHQLAVSDAADPRIDRFVAALRGNPYTHPEPGATCEEIGQGYFDTDAPPPFAPSPVLDDADGAEIVGE